ncbi:hypothetical protein A2U01_0099693, partial [Trifolium medium]|nr:hypothetical protein [Trifolium medium]
ARRMEKVEKSANFESAWGARLQPWGARRQLQHQFYCLLSVFCATREQGCALRKF